MLATNLQSLFEREENVESILNKTVRDRDRKSGIS